MIWIVEIITFKLNIHVPATVSFVVGLVGEAQKLLTRSYAASNVNSAECLFSLNFPSTCKYASL